ncbi:hypothetical protein ACWDUN_25070 [Mycobacterium sp. NPDC003323]
MRIEWMKSAVSQRFRIAEVVQPRRRHQNAHCLGGHGIDQRVSLDGDRFAVCEPFGHVGEYMGGKCAGIVCT